VAVDMERAVRVAQASNGSGDVGLLSDAFLALRERQKGLAEKWRRIAKEHRADESHNTANCLDECADELDPPGGE